MFFFVVLDEVMDGPQTAHEVQKVDDVIDRSA
jgi:hypothetical protein